MTDKLCKGPCGETYPLTKFKKRRNFRRVSGEPQIYYDSLCDECRKANDRVRNAERKAYDKAEKAREAELWNGFLCGGGRL